MAATNPVSSEKFGVYCLANDKALEWFQAFVRSLRKHNPDLPLTVIPYDHSITRLKQLQTEFRFKLMDEPEFTRFDAIAGRVAANGIAGGTFRKLCTFFGEFETFLFLDSDIVVTQPLEPFFKTFAASEAEFVYFDTDMTMVYAPEFAEKMMAEFGSAGFNSGAFFARRGSFTETEIMMAVETGEKIRDCFSVWGEQPFLNYLCDTTRKRQMAGSQLLPGIAEKVWARVPFTHDTSRDAYLDTTGNTLPFIHWAGCTWPTLVRPKVYLRYRTFGMGGRAQQAYTLKFYGRRLFRNIRIALRKFR